MPTYLRWIAAMTAGITAYFAFTTVVLAIAVGTDNRELTGGPVALISLLAGVVTMVAALAVNDWLAARYPQATSARGEVDRAAGEGNQARPRSE